MEVTSRGYTINLTGVLQISHHPVFNPNRPEKMRIVFDCAAQVNEKSYNTEVLQRPHMINA